MAPDPPDVGRPPGNPTPSSIIDGVRAPHASSCHTTMPVPERQATAGM